MVMFDSTRSVIRDGSFSRNIPPEGDGIGLFYSDHLKILDNKIRRNGGPGIHVDHSNKNLIKGNRFSNSSDLAIRITGSDRNRLVHNRITRYAAGVIVGPGHRNVIAKNRIHKGGDGIGIEKGHDNIVARNQIVGPRKSGVYLALDRPPIGGRHTIVRRNVVRGSGKDAFVVRATDRHSLLKGNVAIGAKDDGFEIESRSAKLTGNEARRNGDLGIGAVRGVMDGGGNRASGNGDPRQCTNVVCS
jgi:parallel beta-helix repeat protein